MVSLFSISLGRSRPRHSQRPHDWTQIPEIILLVAPYWSVPDLGVCIRVCRVWHQVCAPILWHTIDDRLYAWPRILSTHDVTALSKPVRDYIRILSGFTRYGSLIRHLRVSWRVMIDIAFTAGTCTQLETLATYNLGNRTKRELAELKKQSELHLLRTGLTYDQRQNMAIAGPLLGSRFDGIFTPSEIEWRTLIEQKKDWLTIQNFWLLIQMNSSTLQVVRLDRSLESLAHLRSNEFLFESLAALPRLTEFDNRMLTLDLSEVLDQLPNLHVSRLSILELNTNFLLKSYETHSLRELEIMNPLPSVTFFSILGKLPNLEIFRIKEFVRREVFAENAAVRFLNRTPTRLKGFHITRGAAHLGLNLAQNIIPWMPHLTSFTVDRIMDETAEALFKYCKNLETIQQADDGVTLFQILPNFYNVAYIHQLRVSKLSTLLHTYPTLRVLDRIDQRLSAENLLAHPWATLNNLTVLRCQIVGIERLTVQEEELLNLASPSWIARLGSDSDLVSKHNRSVTVQQKVLSHIGKLVHLKVLDLGYEWRDVWADSRENCSRYTRDEVSYIAYEKPYADTLELSLISGLAQLSSLFQLQVFGFEGVDHRIGKSELEWISTHWPHLKVMRGLQDDGEFLEKLEPDVKRTALREYMQVLRPDVKHVSLAYKEPLF
ncbi:hypothetical protein FBU30_007698 [Linnemannia zychae]|nr:hypothetical protein FBU30_007698 [Linnemannia zychae]